MSLIMVSAITLACLAITGKAANILQNPDFEIGSLADWSIHNVAPFSPIQPGANQGQLYYPGTTESCWAQGAYLGSPSIDYAFQTLACAPGSTFTADAFFSQYVFYNGPLPTGGFDGSSGLYTSDASGQEDGWVEVLFLGVNTNVLADYRSVILDPPFVDNLADTSGDTVTNGTTIYLNWVDCAVTNQYNPADIVANADPDSFASAITNTLGSGQVLVAPPGTVNVQYRLSVFQAADESGATYWDAADLDLVGGPAPSVIGNLSPDGSKFFNIANTNFTFNISSASAGGAPLPTNPQNGVTVIVNGVNESASLQFTGSPTDLNASIPLTSNQVYNISITVSNSAGLIANNSAVFDTFPTNVFTVNVEDYDFNGGQFIQNPIPTNGVAPNSYWGTAGELGIDQSAASSLTTGTEMDGATSLAPNYPNRTDGNVAFQEASDIEMPFYVAQDNTNIYNVAISFNNGGNWENYTRDPYPQGNYLVYARISGGAGLGQEFLDIVTNGYGTDNQETNNLGVFILPDGVNFSSYAWIELTDSSGTPAVVNIPPGRQTLQLLSGNGENVVDFIFVPVTGDVPPAINNFNPAINIQNNPPVGSQNVFVDAPNITFNVSSVTSTVATSGIQTLLNGVNVSSTASFTWNNTNWT
ncbi:MAG: hypothetical protein ABSF34_12320, partial [Verrucomicrobiota bacterium]